MAEISGDESAAPTPEFDSNSDDNGKNIESDSRLLYEFELRTIRDIIYNYELSNEFPLYNFDRNDFLFPFFMRHSNNLKWRNKHSQGRKQSNGRELKAQREDRIKRTVYVSDVDHNVTEDQLAALFSTYGQVVDCRVCGDPHSCLRFAFVEFADKNSARSALSLYGIMLGFSQIKVLPSKTAILPVNPTFLPKSEDEKEMCARTIYCTNIDKEVSRDEVKNFFEARCGEVVSHIRLSGDHVRSRIAFVEFVKVESAIMALDCSGQTLGTQPIRVSPSKTPVRGRVARSSPAN